MANKRGDRKKKRKLSIYTITLDELTWHWGRVLPAGRFAFQPSNGGMHMTPDMIHTDAIMTAALAGVRVFKYSTAFVMLQYLK
ncbi:hypothetical protein DMENIID0001_057490 [Sergentomyia squamirostris]